MREQNLFLRAVWLVCLVLCLAACGGQRPSDTAGGTDEAPEIPPDVTAIYRVGICQSADNPFQAGIAAGIRDRLAETGAERKVYYEVEVAADGDAGQFEDVDLLIGLTAPAAAVVRREAEKRGLPALFAVVQDPVGLGLVSALDAPGGSMTGTTDAPDTDTLLKLLSAVKPEAQKIGLLYDRTQPLSANGIAAAVEYLEEHGIESVERTGTNSDEMILAAQALVEDGVAAVLTPMDQTVLAAEPSVSGILAEAGIPHLAGAGEFAAEGALIGYGVDYAALIQKTADMAADILFSGADPAGMPVGVFDENTVTVNRDACAALELDPETVRAAVEPLCPRIRVIPEPPAEEVETIPEEAEPETVPEEAEPETVPEEAEPEAAVS